MPLFWLYKNTMAAGKPIIRYILKQRMRIGKEDTARIGERFGRPAHARPDGTVLWVHVASVGEAQSMLRLIDLYLTQNPDTSILVTSITTTSAALLADRLPPRAIHAYFPVDRPSWVRRFLNHWRPDIILWAESELWPCMIHEIGVRRIPTALINARMSLRSFRRWRKSGRFIQDLLGSFSVILAQSADDRDRYEVLGARSVVVAGNIKFAAEPLPYAGATLDMLMAQIGDRPVWVYASTHKGEETLAIAAHQQLVFQFPDLLTIIIPRHPKRRDEIITRLDESGVPYTMRSQSPSITPDTQLYLVDTLGEMGIFYRLAPITVVGRSFSQEDGGGGHNPIEPALLSCAVLHGPMVQNLADIYTPMDAAGAAMRVNTPQELAPTLAHYLADTDALNKLRQSGYDYAVARSSVLHTVIEELESLFILANLPVLKHPS